MSPETVDLMERAFLAVLEAVRIHNDHTEELALSQELGQRVRETWMQLEQASAESNQVSRA